MPVPIVAIGGTPIRVHIADPQLHAMVAQRYATFLDPAAQPRFELEVEATNDAAAAPDEDVRVWREDSEWRMERGDFNARWNTSERRGSIRQTRNPYAFDSVLRIIHTLIMAEQGGFLLHAASGVLNGSAFLFSGISGAGKTTIIRLAPPTVTLLTDEISYVRPNAAGFLACGTPFAGELARPGEPVAAPIQALFFLEKAGEHSVAPLAAADAVQRLMRNILFFSNDPDLVSRVFDSACAFVRAVPPRILRFAPDAGVWDFLARERA